MTETGGPAGQRVMNLATLLTQAARRRGPHPGLIKGEQRWSWADLERDTGRLAAALIGLGIGKGDRILAHSRNGHELVIAMFAVFRIGAIWVPTNFRLTPGEVVDQAETAGACVFLCDGGFPEHAAAVAERASTVRHIVRMCEGTFGDTTLASLIETCPPDAVRPAAAVTYNDPCWFFFTSGTTGKSKAAILTHGQMAFVITNHLADLVPGTDSDDASLVVAPLSHGAGVHMLNQVARAARTVLPDSDRFDAALLWRLIDAHRITNMFTVPTILTMLSDHPDAAARPHPSLRYVIYAGAPMYREDQKRILATIGPVIVQYFGLGEVTGNITVLPPALHSLDDGPDARIGTCGIERTGMQVSVQDDRGKEVPPLETGEICVIGPAVFPGYFDNPKANAEVFRDGWFRTGDVGHMDREGFVYITGRKSDMYISGGSNIYPREIEEKILTNPAVAEVAVLGVPDAKWGESGIAVCALKPGTALSETQLLTWLETHISRYKLPKRVVFLDALPKSGYGKVPKRLVRQTLEERGLLPEPTGET
ncbi:acyl-CoA synthetase [Fodinicurvata sp. EGI_FJ10296]|uniref:acyl-CoA synthetase n=1 Tax=Fodinicurvata sp. EGI_FJ10296 TaxID=3231908 RepID=UPI00345519C7